MSAASRPVVFVHLPRTAGKAFGKLLDTIYEGQGIASFYGDDDEPVVNAKIERFRLLSPAEKSAVSLVKGHVTYGFDPAFKDADYVTLLRQPLSRLVSYYYYALQERQHYLHDYLMQRRMGLQAFLTSDASIDLDNYQVRAISGCHFGSIREKVTQAHCDEAKDRLAHGFKAFGLTERLGESLDRMAAVMGWQLPALQRVNAGRYDPNVAMSASCREHVLEKNRFDVELYTFACALFDSRRAPSPLHPLQ